MLEFELIYKHNISIIKNRQNTYTKKERTTETKSEFYLIKVTDNSLVVNKQINWIDKRPCNELLSDYQDNKTSILMLFNYLNVRVYIPHCIYRYRLQSWISVKIISLCTVNKNNFSQYINLRQRKSGERSKLRQTLK